MERQALRRIEGGSLSADEVERLGETFMLLEQRMEELKETFGLEDEDLNLDLGPLGNSVIARRGRKNEMDGDELRRHHRTPCWTGSPRVGTRAASCSTGPRTSPTRGSTPNA